MGDELALIAINAVLARYADGVNRRDADLWAGTWDEEGEWFLFDPEPVRGREAITAAWQQAMAGFPFVMMIASQGHVEIDGDRAQGHSYTSEIGETADGKHLRIWGCYADRYRRRDGAWRFASRRFTILKSEEY